MFESIFAVIGVIAVIYLLDYYDPEDEDKETFEDLSLEIQHLKEELQVTKDQRSAAFRKIEELLDEIDKGKA